MKAVRISLGMLAFLGIVACKSSEHAAKQVEWADKACACKDIECLTEIEKEQDAWIAEMLALNGVDAYSLQIGQTLILPPFGDGTLPVVQTDAGPPAPPAAEIEPEPAGPPPTSTPTPGVAVFGGGGIPVVPDRRSVV